MGGAQHAVPHIDSPCHWGSTLELISTSLRLKSDLEQLQAALGENVVPLPDNAGWCRLRDAVPSLDVVEMGMAVLGCTSARASQILPVLYHANERLLAIDGSYAEDELGKLFARELDGTIERNLKKHFQPACQVDLLVLFSKLFMQVGSRVPGGSFACCWA